MNDSLIERLLRATGWRGSIARIALMAILYCGILYLPVVVDWASTHIGTTAMSTAQRTKHGGIVYVFGALFLFVSCFEGVRLFIEFIRRWGTK